MIAIPNMSKPKRCVDCVCNNDDYMCNVTHMGIDWQSQQVNEDCPLIEIGDIEYQAYKEVEAMLLKRIEERILYGERRSDESNT